MARGLLPFLRGLRALRHSQRRKWIFCPSCGGRVPFKDRPHVLPTCLRCGIIWCDIQAIVIAEDLPLLTEKVHPRHKKVVSDV